MNINIVPSTKQDLPAMIELLRSSLGEGLIPKSEAYFIWKHQLNPFGASKVLLAKDGDKIVGLRAFMRWRWVSGSEEITAVRAVDTATDPAYQGKGIFKQLTLQAADECKAEGVGLVFNSPNSSSMPGYLKMGWHQAGRMPLYVGPGSLLPRLFSEKIIQQLLQQYDPATALAKLPEDWCLTPQGTILQTPISKKYLEWRYRDCPIVQYGAIIEPGSFGLIFRMKKLNRFVELRICELWTEQKGADAKARKAYRKLLRRLRPVMVSCGPSPLFDTKQKRPLGLLGPFKKGPETTLKPLAKHKLNNFDGFLQWSPSIGTMELF